MLNNTRSQDEAVYWEISPLAMMVYCQKKQTAEPDMGGM